jgi:hypothetical protein
MNIKPRLFLVLPFCLALALGCGARSPERKTSVTGKVTLNGKPVTAGKVIFFKASEPTGTDAHLTTEGAYTLDPAQEGDFTVIVDTEFVNPNKKTEAYGGSKGKKDQMKLGPTPSGYGGPKGEYVKVPDKYTKKETSPLKVTIKQGKQTFNVDMTE